jgi:hypothetical protein
VRGERAQTPGIELAVSLQLLLFAVYVGHVVPHPPQPIRPFGIKVIQKREDLLVGELCARHQFVLTAAEPGQLQDAEHERAIGAKPDAVRSAAPDGPIRQYQLPQAGIRAGGRTSEQRGRHVLHGPVRRFQGAALCLEHAIGSMADGSEQALRVNRRPCRFGTRSLIGQDGLAQRELRTRLQRRNPCLAVGFQRQHRKHQTDVTFASTVGSRRMLNRRCFHANIVRLKFCSETR